MKWRGAGVHFDLEEVVEVRVHRTSPLTVDVRLSGRLVILYHELAEHFLDTWRKYESQADPEDDSSPE